MQCLGPTVFEESFIPLSIVEEFAAVLAGKVRLGAAGNGDDVDVLGHQAVAEDHEAELLAFLLEGLEVEKTVVVGEEYVLAVVASLSGVMQNTLRYHATRVNCEAVSRPASFTQTETSATAPT